MKRLGEPEFWLLVFLAVLLAQSALGLFFPAPEAAGGIDVIIRTSAAGVFGSFLSSCTPVRSPRRTLTVALAGLYCLALLLVLRAASVTRPWLLGTDSATAAVLEGYVLSPSAAVSLSPGGTASVALVCTPEAALDLGAIAGTVSSTGLAGITPVAGAKINLSNLTGTVIASTYSAADGEFVFYDVEDGVYSLTASADGYFASAPVAVTILGGSTANVSLAMVVDGRTYNGTVSGIIRDIAGAPVANCFVGLYAVTEVGGIQTETLLAATRTNSEGKYLFGGVLAGTYMIKAKLEQIS